MQDELNNVFINDALTEGFNLYENNKDKKESLNYNNFLCCVVRMLVLIYGEEELINSFHSKDEKKFDEILTKYGFNMVEVNNFKIICEKFYKALKKQETKAIKKKNKYFNLVQKYLIDMLIEKNNNGTVDYLINNEFYNLLFTVNSTDFYRKSTAVLLAYNPYEIDEYAKRKNLVGGEL